MARLMGAIVHFLPSSIGRTVQSHSYYESMSKQQRLHVLCKHVGHFIKWEMSAAPGPAMADSDQDQTPINLPCIHWLPNVPLSWRPSLQPCPGRGTSLALLAKTRVPSGKVEKPREYSVN